eukprot:3418538-Pleurochrysis_carterae.AAC.1
MGLRSWTPGSRFFRERRLRFQRSRRADLPLVARTCASASLRVWVYVDESTGYSLAWARALPLRAMLLNED